MVSYSNNITDDYRIARVSQVFPDQRGLVRTVEIKFRRRNKKEPITTLKVKPLTSEIVHVQKLSLLQPIGEPIWNGVGEISD